MVDARRQISFIGPNINTYFFPMLTPMINDLLTVNTTYVRVVSTLNRALIQVRPINLTNFGLGVSDYVANVQIVASFSI